VWLWGNTRQGQGKGREQARGREQGQDQDGKRKQAFLALAFCLAKLLKNLALASDFACSRPGAKA